jgi:23S rRNA (adenine2503-C2)-methyltransferase
VSTVGDRRLFERLHAGDFRPALALSLHSADDEQRQRLLPFAPPIPVAELVELAESYARFGAYPVQAQWVLLAGVNDSDADLLRAVPLLRGTRIVLNLIPWNPLPELPYARPDRERCRAAVRLLMRAGVFAKLRWSAGAEADAACGQLRARRSRSSVSASGAIRAASRGSARR